MAASRYERGRWGNDWSEAGMRKVIVNEWMTLDGVVQAPAYANEDASGSFAHGGWHNRYFDDLSMNWVIENVRGRAATCWGAARTRSSPPTGRTRLRSSRSSLSP